MRSLPAALLAIVVLGLGAGGARVRAALPPHPPAVIRDGGTPRPALVARDAKLDARLRHLVAPETAATTSPLEPVTAPWQQGDAVRVHLRVDARASFDGLRQRGLAIERIAEGTVEGWVRTADLGALADADGVSSIRPARPGRLRVTADGAARADLARASGVDGTGVVVGVISDGAGTLPPSVVPAGCSVGSGSEGQALIDVIHTLAPGATTLFAAGGETSLAFIDAVHCLQAAGARVIVDDLGWFDEPFFEDGSVAKAVRAAVQAGVSYHSAAGNEAQSHYSALFHATSGSSYHDFATVGAADNYDEIVLGVGEELDCVLQWNDPFGAASDDYDLELYDLSLPTPGLITSSTNRQTGTQDPLEEFTMVNHGHTTLRTGVAIRHVSGQARVLGLFCFGGTPPQYETAAGSIVGQPAVPEVVAVGAVDVQSPGLATVESFSSQGPVDLYFPARETRAKPDLVGFDGVTTAVPGFSPFYGTSAAAPDTAAVAALMLAKNSCRTPAQIQQALAASAVDIGAPGIDSVSGAGDLDALAALDAVPPPTCTVAAQCDDGNPCTTDVCDGCSCEHRNPCDDGNPCTVDTCDAVNGCVSTPIEGFAGVACVCGQDVAAGACSGTALPAAVRKRFALACGMVARASTITNPTRERRLVGRALGVFTHARQRVSAGARRGTVTGACARAVGAVIDEARVRAAQLRSSL